MTDVTTYNVFIHEGALEALGVAIKPYLVDGPAGPHLVCKEVDSSGGFFEVALEIRDAAGAKIAHELMIPSAMIRLVVSEHSDSAFGFRRSRTVKIGTDAATKPEIPDALPVNSAATPGNDPPTT